jgi:adenylate cyclase
VTRYTADEAAELAGIDPELAARLWVALGFTTSAPGAPVYSDEDVEALRYAGDIIRRGAADADSIVQVTRTIASSVARIADAQVEIAVERARRDGADGALIVDPDIAEKTPWLLGYMWRRHADAALRRAMASGSEEASMVVGFADLVGFTAASQELGEAELAALVDRFESLAHDTVVQLGGRVVKMIGDEVMFTVDTPKAGVEIGLSLSDRYSSDAELEDVRVGMAYGDALQLQGDLYGPPVNLASRIVGIARPRSVVVSESVYDALRDDTDYEWRSLRPRTFKGIGRVPIWRVRRSRTGPDQASTTAS